MVTNHQSLNTTLPVQNRVSSLGGVRIGRKELGKRARFRDCSDENLRAIDRTTKVASEVHGNAVNHLDANPKGSELQTTG